LSLNGFYAHRTNCVATVWNILEITPQLATERMVLRGDNVISIHGRPIVECSNEKVETLMQSELNGEFEMIRKADRYPKQRSRSVNTGARIRATHVARAESNDEDSMVQATRYSTTRGNHVCTKEYIIIDLACGRRNHIS
jgi:hypothetical protein